MGDVYQILNAFRKHQSADVADFLIGTVLSDFLFITAGLVAVVEYVQRPIDCVLGPKFSTPLVKYTESYCHASQTYYDMATTERGHKHQRYELWLPLLLLGHAVLMRLPRFIWHLASSLSGVHFSNLLTAATEYHALEESGKQAMMKSIANLFYAHYSVHETKPERSSNKTRSIMNTLKRNAPLGFLALAYILLTLTNAIVVTQAFEQFSRFLQLGNSSYSYGLDEVKARISSGEQKSTSKSIFPRTFLCDYDIQAPEALHRYSVQCFLPMSHVYDLGTVVLWFLYVLIQPVAWIVFVRSLFILLPWPRRWFIKRHLSLALARESQDRHGNLQEFLNKHILTDAYFILKTMALKVDDLFVSDVINYLYAEFGALDSGAGSGMQNPRHDQTEETMKKPLMVTDQYAHPDGTMEESRM